MVICSTGPLPTSLRNLERLVSFFKVSELSCWHPNHVYRQDHTRCTCIGWGVQVATIHSGELRLRPKQVRRTDDTGSGIEGLPVDTLPREVVVHGPEATYIANKEP